MADADPEAIAEVPPRQLAREVVAPRTRRRPLVWLAVAALVATPIGMHARRHRCHHHVRTQLDRLEAQLVVAEEAKIARLRLEVAMARLRAIKLEARLHQQSFGDLGAADLGGPTRVK